VANDTVSFLLMFPFRFAQMKCLEVNDRLTKLLGDVDNAEWTDDAVAAAAAAGQAQPPPPPMSESLLSEAYSSSVPKLNYDASAADAQGASTTTASAATPAPTSSAAAAGTESIQPSRSEDEFDSFFNERTTGGTGGGGDGKSEET